MHRGKAVYNIVTVARLIKHQPTLVGLDHPVTIGQVQNARGKARTEALDGSWEAAQLLHEQLDEVIGHTQLTHVYAVFSRDDDSAS